MTIRAGIHQTPRRGFNLIESAIVLGFVGLVIGGLWVAARAVIQKQRINETASSVVTVTIQARQFFPFVNYPSTTNRVPVTRLLNKVSILPVNFSLSPITTNADLYQKGEMATTPMGTLMTVFLGYNATLSQFLEVTFTGEDGTWGGVPVGLSTITTSDCYQLIRQVIKFSSRDNSLLQIKIGSTVPINENYRDILPPFTASLDNACPNKVRAIHFYFKP